MGWCCGLEHDTDGMIGRVRGETLSGTPPGPRPTVLPPVHSVAILLMPGQPGRTDSHGGIPLTPTYVGPIIRT